MDSIMQTCLDAGLSVRLGDGGALLVTPAAAITPELREVIRRHRSELLALLLTKAVIAAAMHRCDEFNDSDADRQKMRQDVLALPPHLHADLLEHFNGKPTKLQS